METVAKIIGVTKRFGKVTALSDLTMEVKRGQAVALLGPNGAGKSTALRILQGLRRPTSGTAELFGYSAGSPQAMQKVGVTPQSADFPDQVSPRELIKLATAHFTEPHSINYLIETFDLEKIIDRRIQGFSGGEKRRVALALCFAGNPDLVILDEPTTGLDAKSQLDFQIIAKQYIKNGGSMILTSHYWPEIEGIADHITMIDEGKTVLSGAIADIKAAVGLSKIRLKVQNPGRVITQSFQNEGRYWSLVADDSDEHIRQIITNDEQFSELTITPIGLDEALDVYRAAQA